MKGILVVNTHWNNLRGTAVYSLEELAKEKHKLHFLDPEATLTFEIVPDLEVRESK